MTWKFFSYYGKCNAVCLVGRQNCTDYCTTLQNSFSEFGAFNNGHNWEFQQDNASTHTSQVAKTWFNENNIVVTKWRTRSPDLNHTVNLWGVLARGVHSNRRHYSDIASLKAAIEMSRPELMNLFYGTWLAQCESNA